LCAFGNVQVGSTAGTARVGLVPVGQTRLAVHQVATGCFYNELNVVATNGAFNKGYYQLFHGGKDQLQGFCGILLAS